MAGLFNFARLHPERYRGETRKLLLRVLVPLILAAFLANLFLSSAGFAARNIFWFAILGLLYSVVLPALVRPFVHQPGTSLEVAAGQAAPQSSRPSIAGAPPAREQVLLFLAANPSDTSQLELDLEMRAIRAKLRAAEFRDVFRLESRWAVRPDDLHQALLEVRPSILHFSGHGTDEDHLVLETNSRASVLLTTEAIDELFSVLTDELRLVVLNACFSGVLAQAIVRHVDFAVGMRQAITDEAARTFAASFYRALAFGRTVEEAFKLGKNALRMEFPTETELPELLSRDGVDPGQVVLAG